MTERARSGELRQQLRLALPLVLGQLGHQLMGVVDTAMLGRYSEAALAGVGIANGLLLAISVLGMGIVMGMDTLVPQALGAGERGRARAILGEGVRTALLVAVPITGLVALSPLLLGVIGVPADARAEVWLYILGRLPGIAPYLVLTALRSYLQASSVVRPLVIAVVAMNIVNVLGDALLIFGDRALVRVGLPAVGLPALGSLGAALTTTLVVLVGLAFVALVVRRMHAEIPGPVQREPALQRLIVRIGLPVGAHLMAEVGVFALIAALAGRLGTTAAAAHQIALTVAAFMFHAVLGIGAAASVRVGLAVGAGDHVRARRAGLIGVSMGAAFMLASAVVLVTLPAELARLFTADAAVVAAAVPLFYIAAVFQLSDAVQAITAGALRGAGDTRAVMWVNLAGHYLIGLSTAVVLAFVLDLGATGLWWGLSAGLTTVAVVQLARFVWLTRQPIERSL